MSRGRGCVDSQEGLAAVTQETWDRLLAADGEEGRFFTDRGLRPPEAGSTPASWWQAQGWDEVREAFGSYEEFARLVEAWAGSASIEAMADVKSLEIIGGTDKQGRAEDLRLVFRAGEVVCLVGPTGAGKSQFLADIECMAQGDTPTKRRVHPNGSPLDDRARFSADLKLVAQITQNMNFVMDLGVGDFLRMHAESRGLGAADGAAAEVLARAVEMAGEPFSATTPLTQLSGGQSRALMIADAAYLSPKPIVLIDEIENAGIDRRRALGLFAERGKLVFLSTHDPLLALSGDRRLVFRQGGIRAMLATSDEERGTLAELRKRDAELERIRERLRNGERA